MVKRDHAEKFFVSLLLILALFVLVVYSVKNEHFLSSGMTILSPMINQWLIIFGVFVLSFIVWLMKS